MKQPILYLMFQKKMMDNADKFGYLQRKEALEILNKWHNIPNYVAVAVLKEMENMHLILRPNRHTLRIFKVPEVDKLECAQKLYKEVGLF